MIAPNIITEISKKEGVGWAIVEKDYFITLLLDSIAHSPFLDKHLVFKGGTALRKVYFRHYRYSEDLDFTLTKPLPENEIRENLDHALEYLKKEYNTDFRIKDFHSRKWFSDIKIQFIGIKGEKNTITMDLMSDEVIVDDTKDMAIMNPYYDKAFRARVYSLEEIVAEKLRSLLQRTRVRDYYDVWYLLTREQNKLNKKTVVSIFHKKVEYKKLAFSGAEQLLQQDNLEAAKAYYHRQLGSHLKELPDFEELSSQLREAVLALGL